MNPRELGSTKLNIAQNWMLYFDENAPQDAFFETYAFFQTPYQRVTISTNPPAADANDSFGNSRLRFEFKPGADKQKVLELNAVAYVGYYGVEFEALAPGEEEKYLASTELTEAGGGVKALAETLADGAIDDYDVVARFTDWIRNNVEYDASYWKRAVPAEQTISEKRGVCNQFATLLIALLKSRGIPARFTAGLVFSGESWGPHAWVEAGINSSDGMRRWLPVDPTFGEVGILDAGHVKFAHGLDQNDISEVGTAGVDVVKGELRVSVVQKTNFAELFDVSLNAPSVVGSGSAEEVAIAVKSKAGAAAALPFIIVVPTQPQSLAVRVADGESRILYLQPGEEKAVSWRLVFPSELKEGFTYNFTVAVQGLGKRIFSVVQGKAGVESHAFQKISITRFSARDEGANELFSIVVVNEGNEGIDGVDVVGEFNGLKQRESFSLSAGEEKRVSFVFVKPAEPGVYSGSFKAADAVSGASAEQPFQLEITKEGGEAQGGISLPNIQVPLPSAGAIPEEYFVYGAAAVCAAALVFAVIRARRGLNSQKTGSQTKLAKF